MARISLADSDGPSACAGLDARRFVTGRTLATQERQETIQRRQEAIDRLTEKVD